MSIDSHANDLSTSVHRHLTVPTATLCMCVSVPHFSPSWSSVMTSRGSFRQPSTATVANLRAGKPTAWSSLSSFGWEPQISSGVCQSSQHCWKQDKVTVQIASVLKFHNDSRKIVHFRVISVSLCVVSQVIWLQRHTGCVWNSTLSRYLEG